MVMTDIFSGILLVLRYKKTTYNDVSEAMNTVKLANANLLGFIINDVNPQGLNTYYRSYYAYRNSYSENNL